MEWTHGPNGPPIELINLCRFHHCTYTNAVSGVWEAGGVEGGGMAYAPLPRFYPALTTHPTRFSDLPTPLHQLSCQSGVLYQNRPPKHNFYHTLFFM